MKNKKIYIFLGALMLVVLFSFNIDSVQAAYNCSLGGTYSTLTDCNNNCEQTSNCTPNDPRLSGTSRLLHEIGIQGLTDRIRINGYYSTGDVYIFGATISGNTGVFGDLLEDDLVEISRIRGAGSQLCFTFARSNLGSPTIIAEKCLTVSGATVSGNVTTNSGANPFPWALGGFRGSGNLLQVHKWGSSNSFTAGNITFTTNSNYICPLGSYSCSGSPQSCTQPGVCTYACTDTSWSPSPSTVCFSGWFEQTSNCGNTRWVTGTKPCYSCSGASCVYSASGGNYTSSSCSNACTPSPPTCNSRYWNPSFTTVGGSSRFYWNSTDATSAALSCSGPSPLSSTSVPVDGSRLFSNFPSSGTETCRVNLSGPGGTGSCNRSIVISPPASPTCTSSWSPSGPLTNPDNSTFSWNSTNATNATFSCTGPNPRSSTSVTTSGSSNFSFNSSGTETCRVNLSGPGGSTSCFRNIVINSTSPPTLTATLNANPSSGTAPLTSNLTTTVGGTATGPITYSFRSCGGGIASGISGGTFNCTYINNGTYTASITIWRQGLTDTATALITVNAAPVTSYDLTVDVTGSGTGKVTGTGINCPVDCTESYNIGTNVILTPSPSGGSEFSDWSGCDSLVGGNRCMVTMNANKAVTAKFNLNCAPNPGCTANTCVGDKCTDGCGIEYNGTKNCDDYNWREVPPQ